MKQLLLILGTLFALLFGSWYYSNYWCPLNTPEILQSAESSYKEGELGQNVAQRKDNFNRSLTAYQELEKQYFPEHGTGKLYFNLGNAYYQLEQYPWAALYYYKAQKLMPREEKPKLNLNLTLNKLQQPKSANPTIWEKLFLIGPYISIPEALQIFAFAIILLFILMTIWIWNPKKYLKMAMVLTGLFLIYLSAALGYQKYIAPLNAVIVKATPVYRDAGTQYSQVLNDPLSAGSKVEIIQLMSDSNWVKVLLPQGAIGFIPLENLRII